MTVYEMRISDWSSDVCSSDLADRDRRHLRHEFPAHARTALGARLPLRAWPDGQRLRPALLALQAHRLAVAPSSPNGRGCCESYATGPTRGSGSSRISGRVRPVSFANRRGTSAFACARSEEQTSELQSLMSLSYAVFC